MSGNFPDFPFPTQQLFHQLHFEKKTLLRISIFSNISASRFIFLRIPGFPGVQPPSLARLDKIFIIWEIFYKVGWKIPTEENE